MSFWTYRKAVFESALPAPTKMVLLCLDYHVNANGDPVWPSLTRIMALTSLSRRTVIDHLKAAENAGWLISRSRHVENGRQTSNIYQLVAPAADGSWNMQSHDAPFDLEGGEGAAGAPSGVQQAHSLNCPQGKRVLNSSSFVQEEGAHEQPDKVCIPLNTGEEYAVDGVLTAELKTAYPATDVEGELRKMRAWCLTNPTKRKTRRGILKFINNWLSNVQDKGGSHRGGGQKQAWLDTLIGRGEQHGESTGNTYHGSAVRVD